MASGSCDKTVGVWEVWSGEQVWSGVGHEGAVVSLAYHPSGELLASTSADRTIRLWDNNMQVSAILYTSHILSYFMFFF